MTQRKLTYRNRFVEDLVQSVSVDCTNLNPVIFPDMTTQIPLAIKLSQEEFTKLYTTIMFGADLAYPDEAIEVMALFLQLVDCDDMDFCSVIADCIDDNATTQASIVNLLIQAGYGSGGQTTIVPVPLSTTQTAANLLPVGYVCDTDSLCGMSRYIVNNLHDGVGQLLQQLEAATNVWELFATFVDNVEGVSWVGSILEFMTWTQDQLIEYYELAWSTVVEDALTCDVFCQIEPSCEVTIDGLLTAYEDAILESFSLPTSLDDITALWTWATGLDYEFAASKAVVASFHWIILQALRFGSKALGYTTGIRTFEQMIATGEDETDTYCASSCVCAGDTWAYYIDLTTELGNWIEWDGAWVDGVGIVSEWIGGKENASVYITFDAGYVPQRISVEYTRTSHGSFNDDIRVWQWTDIDTLTGGIQWLERDDTETGAIVYCPSSPPSASNRLQIQVQARDNNEGNTVTLTGIKLFSTTDVTPPAPLVDNSDPVC